VRVFRPAVPDGFEWVFPLDERDWEILRSFDGSPRASTWTPIAVRLGYSQEDTGYQPATMPWMGSHVLVFKQEALRLIGTDVGRWGELLPLECHQTDLVVFNPTQSVSALDQGRSSVVRFGDGRIVNINTHVFSADAIENIEIFKLKEMPRGSLYLTGHIVETIESNGLEGTDFELLWSDETDWPPLPGPLTPPE